MGSLHTFQDMGENRTTENDPWRTKWERGVEDTDFAHIGTNLNYQDFRLLMRYMPAVELERFVTRMNYHMLLHENMKQSMQTRTKLHEKHLDSLGKCFDL